MAKEIAVKEAIALIERALVKNNVSAENAKSVADALVAAEVDGQKGHGFSRVASYCAQAKSGKVEGHAKPIALKSHKAAFIVDAANGFAFPAIDLAIEKLSSTVSDTGIAMAGIRRSHHCGQLGAHVERLANEGFVALMVSNSPKAMAPWGGSDPLFGTNPIAFAAPRVGNSPLVIDLSLSKVARGKVMAAAKANEQIPEGWALDKDGNPTTDPTDALAGTMVPAGDAKGAALALIVEILSATLIGANHSYEASSFFDAEGPSPGVGHTLFALDTKLAGSRHFAERIEELFGEILRQSKTRLPGSGKQEVRRAATEHGLSIPEHLFDEIVAIG